jgi:bifunctional non-homologous end joining protein LigD
MPLPLVDPILPLLSRDLPRGADWRYELKLDGFRGTLYVEKKRAWFRSKKGHVMRRFDELARRVAGELGARSAILDGEIVVMGERGPDFYALMFGRGVPQFAAFDLLWLDGRDLRPRAYTARKAALRRVIDRRAACVWYVDGHDDDALFDAAQRMDLEGVVAKRRDEPYGPATKWIKVKSRGYSQIVGRWELFHKKGGRSWHGPHS